MLFFLFRCACLRFPLLAVCVLVLLAPAAVLDATREADWCTSAAVRRDSAGELVVSGACPRAPMFRSRNRAAFPRYDRFSTTFHLNDLTSLTS